MVGMQFTSHLALGFANLACAQAAAAQQTQTTSPQQQEQPASGTPVQGEAPPGTTANGAAASARNASAEAAPDGTIGDIIVTATRRETSLQRTPQAISVLDGAALQLQGRSGLSDIKQAVPNVNFAATSNTVQLYIRGIGNTFINAGGYPGVALYQDAAYISDQTSANTTFFDVGRVEVLRGPQGALYGRNAPGGAINVISARPLPDPQGQLSVTAGNYGRIDSEGYVTGPLGLADTDVRVSFQTRHLNG